MSPAIDRRQWLLAVAPSVGLGLGLGRAGQARGDDEPKPRPAPDDPDASRFRLCLNTATVQGFKLPVAEQVELAARAGYAGIEPWIRDLDRHAADGGSLDDLGKKIRDLGLVVPSAIGFFNWGSDDDAERAAGLEEARRSMEVVRSIGGLRVAAPPFGLTDRDDVDPRRLADRYRELLTIGDRMGVVPELEVWGFSKTLGRLGEAARVVVDADHPSACILADIYHLHKGGSGFNGLRLLSGAAMPVFHFNDFPARPPRETIGDADRVYPGDGIAPLADVLRDLRAVGFDGWLSLELFNPEYWRTDPELVATTGLAKMEASVAQATG